MQTLSANQEKGYPIYNQLCQYSGKTFRVVFGQTFHWGEAHPGGAIILDISTLNKDNNILAFVFAHEWAHQALGHQPNIYNPSGNTWKMRITPTQDEDEADFYAGKFMAQYGYNLDIVVSYLKNLPTSPAGDTHSSGVQRGKTVTAGYHGTSAAPTQQTAKFTQIECAHRIPCQHAMPCAHNTPCIHRTPCQHQAPCTHRITCQHQRPCLHRMPCTHQMPCQHIVATPYGPRAMHPYDIAHPFDTAHPFDQSHDFDTAHSFDTAHPFDTAHIADLAHERDQMHQFDYLHPFDIKKL